MDHSVVTFPRYGSLSIEILNFGQKIWDRIKLSSFVQNPLNFTNFGHEQKHNDRAVNACDWQMGG